MSFKQTVQSQELLAFLQQNYSQMPKEWKKPFNKQESITISREEIQFLPKHVDLNKNPPQILLQEQLTNFNLNDQFELWNIILASKTLFSEERLSKKCQEQAIEKRHLYLIPLLTCVQQKANLKNLPTQLFDENSVEYSILIKGIQDQSDESSQLMNYVAMNFSEKNGSIDDIQHLFFTAYFSFFRIKNLSNKRIILRMGFEGTEYFNNNPMLVAILLFLAAECAQIECLQYSDSLNFKDIQLAQQIYLQIRNDSLQKGNSMSYIFETLTEMKFQPKTQKPPKQIQFDAAWNPNNDTEKKSNEKQQELNKGKAQIKNDLYQSDQTNLAYLGNKFNVAYSSLLQVKIVELFHLKQLLYKKFFKNLNDKFLNEQTLQYQRCLLPTSYSLNPINFKNLDCKQLMKGYEYLRPPSNVCSWHINFAHDDVFAFYSSPLYAQDEIQTSEHPIIYHLREYLLKFQVKYPALKPSLFTEDKQPSPVLVYNALRQGQVDTNSTAENQSGLYGNSFMQATDQAVDKASKAFEISEIIPTNLICMSSLSLGKGEYSEEQITKTFNIVYKSFREAVLFSKFNKAPQCKVEINTGNWGCGAFGNNLELIAILQILAAHAAGVDTLKYYTFSYPGKQAYESAIIKVQAIIDKYQYSKNWKEFIAYSLQYVKGLRFKWAQGDGN